MRIGTHARLVMGVVSAAALVTGAWAEPPSAADAVRELQAFYRAGPTCERVQVELRTAAPAPAVGTKVTRSSMVVRVQPKKMEEKPKAVEGDATPTPSTPPTSAPPVVTSAVGSIGLELGQLRIWAADGSLLAVHTRDPTTFFRAPISEELRSSSLAEALPPVLMPEVDLAACAAGETCTEFWPYATGIVWQGVEPDAKQAGRRIVRGTCEGGTVVLTMQGTRLRTLVIDMAQKKTTLTLGFAPFIPCEPAKQAIQVGSRLPVASMDELRPRSGTLRVGFRVPPMPITQAAGPAWDIGALLQPPLDALAAGVRPAEHAVLVLVRRPPANAGGRFRAEELAPILARMRREAFKARMPGEAEREPGAVGGAIAKFGYAPVLAMAAPKPDELLGILKSEAEKWGPDVLWTTEPKGTIDLFAPGADACCVVIDADYVLRAVVVVDPGQTAEMVADQIAAALFELGAAETK